MGSWLRVAKDRREASACADSAEQGRLSHELVEYLNDEYQVGVDGDPEIGLCEEDMLDTLASLGLALVRAPGVASVAYQETIQRHVELVKKTPGH